MESATSDSGSSLRIENGGNNSRGSSGPNLGDDPSSGDSDGDSSRGSGGRGRIRSRSISSVDSSEDREPIFLPTEVTKQEILDAEARIRVNITSPTKLDLRDVY